MQSSTLLEMSVEGELPRYDLIVFADTGNEPEAVYRHLEYLKTRASVSVVSIGNIYSDTLKNNRFASMPLYLKMPNGTRVIARRQCTNEYKIQPIKRAVLDYLSVLGMARLDRSGAMRVTTRKHIINMHLGISVDERQRMAPSRVLWQQNKYPLIEMDKTRGDCIAWLKEKSLPIPPKSSCIVCPYHNDEYWLSLTRGEFESACQFDEQIRNRRTNWKATPYLHSSCIPLRDVKLSARVRPIQLAFATEVMFGKCKGNAGFSCFS